MYYILGLDSCPYCRKAEGLLDDLGIEYKSLNAREAIKEEPYKTFKEDEKLKTNSKGRLTVPIIFREAGKDVYVYIGGYEELCEYKGLVKGLQET